MTGNPYLCRRHTRSGEVGIIVRHDSFSAFSFVVSQKMATFAADFAADYAMRVLQLGKFYPVQGGVEKVMYDLLVGLSERGIRCDMLCANVDKGRTEVHGPGGCRIICTKTLVKKYATMISPQMITTLRRIAPQYDIIHVHHLQG